ncbi:MAG TPA: haloacid dehalogenase [Rhodobacteraceae bacterium]|nr:haloacid dehalogenase [Paracoccaceae bacterium]
MQTVIFDLDGTLADTSGDLIAAANACFRKLGHGDLLSPVKDQLTAFHGGRAMLRLGFDRLDLPWTEAEVDAQYPYLLEYYRENIDVFTKLYDRVVPALDRLATRGVPMGVCTNKPEDAAEILLTRLGLRDRFGAMLGADTLPVRKPDPEHLFETIRRLGGIPSQSVLIGPTMTDRKTAKAADIPCVLVTFGPEGRAVSRMEPEGLLDHYDDLDQVLAAVMRTS